MFYIFKEDPEGHYSLSEGYVAHVLSVTQDAESNLFVVLALEDDSVSDSEDRKPSKILVFEAIQAGRT